MATATVTCNICERPKEPCQWAGITIYRCPRSGDDEHEAAVGDSPRDWESYDRWLDDRD